MALRFVSFDTFLLDLVAPSFACYAAERLAAFQVYFFFPAAFYVGYSAEDYFIRNVFHMSHL